MEARESVPFLSVYLPDSDNAPILFRSAVHGSWHHAAGPLPAELSTENLWQQLEEPRQPQDTDRRALLTAAGARLGRWLFDARAADAIREAASQARLQHRQRIELFVPANLTPWPWELAHIEGLGAPAVHAALSVVRVSTHRARPPLLQPPLLCVETIGVQLDHAGSWPALNVHKELGEIFQQINQAGNQGRFSLRADYQGSWEELSRRYSTIGPPHVFHFAGHGLPNGRGLLFRGPQGEPLEVKADQIAQLLCRKLHDRQTLLAFLNACSTIGAGPRPAQPFGGLGLMLLQHGVPMVIGAQTPLYDWEASMLAAEFYRRVADGAAVDCALQAARERLFLDSRMGLGWAFISLSVAGAPEPLFRDTTTALPPVSLLNFGHEDQRQRMMRFMDARRPMVVVVHGEVGRGHRHVIERIQVDLEKHGNVLWRPVATMHWFDAGEPRLTRGQLVAGIARAIGLRDIGRPEKLESDLASELAQRCADGKVVIIDLPEVLLLSDQQQADALLEFVERLFSELMEKAHHYRDSLPIYMLLSVAYPRKLATRDKKRSREVADMLERTRRVVARMAEHEPATGDTLVNVLPELEPFSEDYVAQFLTDVVVGMGRKKALAIARNLVGPVDDNETILRHLRDFFATENH